MLTTNVNSSQTNGAFTIRTRLVVNKYNEDDFVESLGGSATLICILKAIPGGGDLGYGYFCESDSGY